MGYSKERFYTHMCMQWEHVLRKLRPSLFQSTLYQNTVLIVHESLLFIQQLNLALLLTKWEKNKIKKKIEHLCSNALKILLIYDEDESHISFWETANKNIFCIFSPPVHQNGVTSVLPPLEAHIIPCDFVCVCVCVCAPSSLGLMVLAKSAV